MMSPDNFYDQLPQLNDTAPAPMQFGPQNQPAAGQPPVAPRPAAPVQRPVAPPQAAAPKAPKPPTTEEMLQEFLSYEPSKDPEVQASREKQKGLADKESAATDQFIESIIKFNGVAPPPPPPVLKEEAPKFHDFAVKNSPWLMILSAVGGKIGKISGIGMLKAQTGMLKGLNEGNKEAFDQAFAQYQEHTKAAMDAWKNDMAVYNANLDWRKGQVDAQHLAVAAYKSLRGEEATTEKNLIGEHMAQEKVMVALQRDANKLANQKAGLDARKEKRLDDELKAYSAATTGFARLQSAQYDTQTALKLLPAILNKYKSENPTTVPKSLGDILTALSDDPNVATFKGALDNAKPLLASLEIGKTRGNIFLQSLVSGTIPSNFWSMPPAQIDYQVKNAAALINDALAQQKQNVEMWRTRVQATGGMALPDLPTFNQAPPEPADAPVPAAPAASKGTPSIFDQADSILKGK